MVCGRNFGIFEGLDGISEDHGGILGDLGDSFWGFPHPRAGHELGLIAGAQRCLHNIVPTRRAAIPRLSPLPTNFFSWTHPQALTHRKTS